MQSTYSELALRILGRHFYGELDDDTRVEFDQYIMMLNANPDVFQDYRNDLKFHSGNMGEAINETADWDLDTDQLHLLEQFKNNYLAEKAQN